MLTAILIGLRILAGPFTNVFQKKIAQKGVHPLFIVLATHIVLTAVFAPIFLMEWTRSPVAFPSDFWWLASTMGILDALGNIFLVYAVSRMDFSVFGPLNAFKPIIATALGILMIQEWPSVKGVLGTGIILSASLLLKPRSNSAPDKIVRRRDFVYRFLAMIFASLGAVLSKMVLQEAAASVIMFFWSFWGIPVALIVSLRMSPGFFSRNLTIIGRHLSTLAAIVMFIAAMQIFTLLVFKRIQVSYSLAFFQLSALVSVILGKTLFEERYFRRRLVAALFMMIGAAAIICSVP
ncbi:MAG: hypothetical protein EHM72_00890 [Calditrichaeota bacterium]|nr:MAG: hypothetical protein EHM72_00890 [Calditrichota bacterium]